VTAAPGGVPSGRSRGGKGSGGGGLPRHPRSPDDDGGRDSVADDGSRAHPRRPRTRALRDEIDRVIVREGTHEIPRHPRGDRQAGAGRSGVAGDRPARLPHRPRGTTDGRAPVPAPHPRRSEADEPHVGQAANNRPASASEPDSPALAVRGRVRLVGGEAGRALAAAQGRALSALLASVGEVEVEGGKEVSP
jgi:hypothetical protein